MASRDSAKAQVHTRHSCVRCVACVAFREKTTTRAGWEARRLLVAGAVLGPEYSPPTMESSDVGHGSHPSRGFRASYSLLMSAMRSLGALPPGQSYHSPSSRMQRILWSRRIYYGQIV